MEAYLYSASVLEGEGRPVGSLHNQVHSRVEEVWSGEPNSLSHNGSRGSGMRSVITVTGSNGMI